MSESQIPQRRQVTVRRAPKFGVFLALGVMLAFIVAMIFALTGPESAEHSRFAILGFFTAILAVPGVAVGALAALILDRISIRKSREATFEAINEEEDQTSPPS